MNTDAKPNVKPVEFGWHSEPWLVLPSLTLGIALVVFLAATGHDWYLIVPAFMFLLVIGGSIGWRGRVDISNREVVEQARLFDRWVLRTRTTPLDDFKSITFEYRGTEADEKWWVGLRLKSGRRIWLRGCGTELRYAEEFAWRLSCDTNLKMEEVRRRKSFGAYPRPNR